MTTIDQSNDEKSPELIQNLAKVDDLSKRLLAVFEAKKDTNRVLNGPGTDLFLNAMTSLWQTYSQDPVRIWAQQISYWDELLAQFSEFQKNDVGKPSVQ
jgi:polyhydroxyalkanoate synthase